VKRAAAFLLSSLLAPSTWAQYDLTGSVALQSEYRYRGQTPGDSGPVPQLTLNLDTPSGWYIGGFASGVRIASTSGYKVQAYAGYAQRLASGLTWEAGCDHIGYTQVHINDYNECYGGLSGERLSGRLSYAPHYAGYAARVLYGELNAFYPVHPRVNLIAHGGLLYNHSNGTWPSIPNRSRYDLRLGAAIPFGNWTLQVAREYSRNDGTRYYGYPVHPAKAWTMGATYAF
jgi:uncharacterized protein (TIGR02001 family)